MGSYSRQAAAISDYKYSKAMIDYGKELLFKEIMRIHCHVYRNKNGFRRFEKRERSVSLFYT